MRTSWKTSGANHPPVADSAVAVNSSLSIAEFSTLFRMAVAVRTIGIAQTPALNIERMIDVATTPRRFQNWDFLCAGIV